MNKWLKGVLALVVLIAVSTPAIGHGNKVSAPVYSAPVHSAPAADCGGRGCCRS
ncbi:MAG: hypothetical protein SNJ82_01750 [Gemmataceae bacterium]